nr:hypothetical protein [Chitinophagaceae bacterium]
MSIFCPAKNFFTVAICFVFTVFGASATPYKIAIDLHYADSVFTLGQWERAK